MKSSVIFCSARAWHARWFVLVLAAASLCASWRQAVAQDDQLSLVVELLRDADKDIRALALDQVRSQHKGEAATRKFAELLSTVPPATQTALLSALAARADAAAMPEIRKTATSTQDEAVRSAAIDAMGYLGDDTDVAYLADQFFAGSDAAKKVARASLARMPGEKASQSIVARLQQAAADQRIPLIEILTDRRAGANEILALASDDDPKTRSAAMKALGKIASPELGPAMVSAVLIAKSGSERTAAERAVAEVCLRADAKTDRGQALLSAVDKLDAKNRNELLPLVGRVGGPAALAAAEKAFADKNGATHSAGLKALCNWPDGTVALRLLELARSEDHPAHRTLARRALIRIAPLEDDRSDARRLDLLKTLYAMCPDDAERNDVLARVHAVRTIEALRFVLPFVDQPAFSKQACTSVVELAHQSRLRAQHQEEFHRALDKVLATTKDPTLIERSNRYKAGQTWERPKTAS